MYRNSVGHWLVIDPFMYLVFDEFVDIESGNDAPSDQEDEQAVEKQASLSPPPKEPSEAAEEEKDHEIFDIESGNHEPSDQST